jgi:hypothetical protein
MTTYDKVKILVVGDSGEEILILFPGAALPRPGSEGTRTKVVFLDIYRIYSESTITRLFLPYGNSHAIFSMQVLYNLAL